MRRWLLITLLLLPLPAGAATYTVAPTGNDSHPGTTGQPWRSVQHAASRAVAGDTVHILPGTYSERVTFPTSGTASQPITFVGTRGSQGSWETIIDGTTPVTATWTASGSGVYQASLGYNPGILTAGNLYIWRIGDHAWSTGEANKALARAADATVTTAMGTVQYWDGIEALYGVQGGVTHLRFRPGQDPASMQVRAGPAGGTLTLNGVHHVVLRALQVQGGERGVDIRGGATGTRIEQCRILHGPWRVHIDGGASATVLRGSTLTQAGYGMQAITPGDWSSASYNRMVNRHRYDTAKFLIGNSQTHDASVLLRGAASDTVITQNTFTHAMAGVTFYGSSTNTVLTQNQLYEHADNCVYIDSDSSSATFHHNLVYDCDHGMRFNTTHRDMRWTVYANAFWQPEGNGKHIFIAPPNAPPNQSTIQIYHNSFAGTGWAVDVGSDGQQIALPFVHLRNLLLSVSGLSSWGGVSWGTKEGLYADTLWSQQPLPDFQLPPGHPARDSAPDLTALTLPGMDAAYYVDGTPDYGALQGPGGTLPPEPPSGDTTPPTIQITAPAPDSVVSGTVAVAALASDNVQVTGVQFYLGGAAVGEAQCCVSIDVLADSTRVPDGRYVLTAEARDAAGNTTLSAPVAVEVQNQAPPEPPQPGPGTLVCTGSLVAVPGPIEMRCAPQEGRR